MINLFVPLICLLVAVSCTTNSVKMDEATYSASNVYQGSGVESVFLSGLPTWAEFSSVGNCRHDFPIRLLNHKVMKEKYSLSYKEILDVQYILNREIYSKTLDDESLGLKEENLIFLSSFDRVEGGATAITLPNYKEINLVWVDPGN